MWLGKKIVYVDMDHVLCDYQALYDRMREKQPDVMYPQSQAGFFLSLNPIKGAIKSYGWLSNHPEIKPLILTAPSVLNPHCYTEKRIWVEKHLGIDAVSDLIITSHKHLNIGDYLIDDQAAGRGQEWFSGALIQFGSATTPNWDAVIAFIQDKLKTDRNI